jgi:hypothetical protein
MPAQCVSPIQGTMMRIVRLDVCGIPVTGAGNLVVTDGFVQVEVTQQYEDGTEYQQKKANGEYCVNDVGPDQFQRSELSIQFCGVDPDVVNIITGSSLVSDGATGTGFWVTEDPLQSRFSLEVWQGLPPSEACLGGAQRHVYWAWPHLAAGRFNDFTIEDGSLEWTLSARSRPAAPEWGTGPVTGDAWITAVPDRAHFGFNINDLDLPDPTGCGAVALA